MPNLRRGMMAAAGVSTASASRGTMWGWGENAGGLGQSNQTNYSSPVQIGSLTDWATLDFDDYGKCSFGFADDSVSAINGDGELFTWGFNSSGQLGQGNTTGTSSPIQVGSLSDWATCTGGYQKWAIKTDGTWWYIGGSNALGSAGQGNTTAYCSPVQIGTETYWSKCAGNNQNGYAITNHGSSNDGQLWSVGGGYAGALGVGNETNYSSPVQVGSLETWSQLSSGAHMIMAIRSDGALFGFGYNTQGNLGIGTADHVCSPVQVGSLTDWALVRMGYKGDCWAVKTDGTLWAWGVNTKGGLGLGDTTNYCSPVQVGSLTDWKIPGGGRWNMACIKTDGTLWTCGYSSAGRLGNGTSTPDISSPAQVGSDTDWVSMGNAQGGAATIAIRSPG